VAGDEDLFIGKGDKACSLTLKRANRHGLIAGATGTGKTVTLQVLAEGLSAAGVPVFCADVKGDLSGISQAGKSKPFIAERAKTIGLETPLPFAGAPVIFWDLFGEKGHPIRATITDMGPALLARLLGLNDTQEGVLTLGFKLADDEGLPLLDVKDLRALMVYVGEHRKELALQYGSVSPASIGAIQRKILAMDEQGSEGFFGEPALKLTDFMRTDQAGRGYVNLLAADRLIQDRQAYATFLLWLLSELFEELPEVGDPDKPKLCFFFDEAHLLFKGAPKALVDKIEQVVKLIRSKGVGVYFITQSPSDVPDAVLAQLGNRVQHALRAFTPRDRRAVRAAADSFRPNPKFDTAQVIGEMGVGEALVSTLDAKGVPAVVERALIRPPLSRIGPATAAERKKVLAASPLAGVYDTAVDRESAFEMLKARAEQQAAEAEKQVKADAAAKAERSRSRRPSRGGQSMTEQVLKTAARTATRDVTRQVTRSLIRGLLGSLLR